MRLKLLLLPAITMLAVSTGLCSTIDLANPGFEDGTTSPVGWGTAGSGTYNWVTGSAGVSVHRGLHALSIAGAVAGGAVNMRWVQLSTSYFTLAPTQQLSLSAWIKGSTDWDLAKDGYRFQIEYLDGSNAIVGSWASSSGGVNLLSSTSWTQYTQTSAAAPTGTVKARISLVFGRLSGSTSTSPVVTFDDISAFVAGSAVNNAYPEPFPSWTSTDITNQRAAAQALLTTLANAGNGTAASPVNITIAPGDYRFDVVPYNQVKLTSRSYLHITATGVRFWFDPFLKDASNSSTYGLSLVLCNNVTIDGLTIDYTKTPYVQGIVSSIDTATGAVTFALEPGFTDPTTVPTAESTPIVAGGKILFFDANGMQIPTLLDYPCSCCVITANSGGTYTVIPQGGLTMYGRTGAEITSTFMNPGAPARVAIAARRWRHAVILDRSVACQLSNVTVYSSPQMGLSEQNGNGTSNSYTGCKVVPRPNTDRLLSSNADGFHSLGMSSGPQVQNCEIAYTGDDIMNIHGLLSYVYSVDSSNLVTLGSQITPDLAAPTTIRFYSQPYLKPKYDPANVGGDFNVAASPAPIGVTSSTDAQLKAVNKSMPSNGFAGAFQTFLGYPVAPLTRLTVDQNPGPTGADVWLGDIAMKRSNIGAGASVQNNYFHDCFSRGIIISGENSTVSGNYLYNIGTCSISISPSIRFMEGPYSRNMTVTGNIIENNGWTSNTCIDPNTALIGAITVTGDALFGTRPHPRSAEHSNITITNNTIINSRNCGIFVTDVTTGTVSGNTIQNPYYGGTIDAGAGWKKLDFDPAPNVGICVADSDHLTVSSNTVTSTSPAPTVAPFGSYGWLTNFVGP